MRVNIDDAGLRRGSGGLLADFRNIANIHSRNPSVRGRTKYSRLGRCAEKVSPREISSHLNPRTPHSLITPYIRRTNP